MYPPKSTFGTLRKKHSPWTPPVGHRKSSRYNILENQFGVADGLNISNTDVFAVLCTVRSGVLACAEVIFRTCKDSNFDNQCLFVSGNRTDRRQHYFTAHHMASRRMTAARFDSPLMSTPEQTFSGKWKSQALGTVDQLIRCACRKPTYFGTNSIDYTPF